MTDKGLLIDFNYCCGCHSCEVACQKEHGYGIGQFGMSVLQSGPWRIEGMKGYQYDYVPFPTKLCDLCAQRVADGRLPTCVQHCPTNCLAYGDVDDLAAQMVGRARLMIIKPR